ncbi:MAG TPA: AmmeMemoRadiSam system radical SAM enzyme [bacterium]|nr:AmmeMemoRadiSam system radical SAM enzyme [bacterium]
MMNAQYWKAAQDGKVNCCLCPHNCSIGPGHTGVCRVRVNKEGTLIAANYGRVSSMAMDPVEKKPLYHFYPGRDIFSIGTVGCNLRCSYCQNYTISQQEAPTRLLSPDQAVQLVLNQGPNCIGIAFTYNEPFMWYEYVLATAKKARAAGVKTVMVTNGFVRDEPLQELLQFIDAMNIDLKAFSESTYRKLCGGSLQPVLDTVEAAVRFGCHVEATTLIIPTYNDSAAEIESLSKWLANLSPQIPLHLSRYFPQYKLSLPPTPLKTLEQAFNIARASLNYVYIGNADLGLGRNTCCPCCGATLIKRQGYSVRLIGLKEGGSCANCGFTLTLVTD